MLTVLLSTARAPKCFTHQPDWNQFEVLARCLKAQTHRDFELVIVTPFVDEAREAIGNEFPSTVVPPRDTPWRRAKMFAICSARNTGLVHARGDWVLTIDDCCEFDSDLLSRVVTWAERGKAVAVLYRGPDGVIHDSRWRTFAAHGREWMPLPSGISPYGYISFPLRAAVEINGYDELHFDGARGLEDVNFAKRLAQCGVNFIMDRNIIVTLHDHLGYPPEIINNEEQNARCCNTAFTLAHSLVANKSRYSHTEKQQVLNCMHWQSGGCKFHGRPCAYPKWATTGRPIARQILLTDEEELFDLAATRTEKGMP